MYKCLNCGNTDKFYGIAKEQGNALIFQNCLVVNGSDGSSVLEEALNALRKTSDRHKQPVGALSGSNAVFIDEGPFRTGTRDAVSGVPDKKHLPKSGGDPGAAPADPDMTIRGNLWAIQTDEKGEDVTWAYMTSDRSWKGFHEVRSCAVCRSTSIASI